MDLYSKYFVPFPTIRTPRLTLRKILKTDLHDLYDYCKREESSRYSNWSPHRDIYQTKSYISWMKSRYAKHDGFTFAVENIGGKVIGTASYIDFDENYGTVEIGYGINSDYWHQGFGKEIVSALIFFAFEKIGVQRVFAKVMPENTRSSALLTSCGFTFEGINRRAVYLKGGYRDIAVYSLLSEEYYKTQIENNGNKFQIYR